MKKIFLIRDRKAFSTKWVCDFGSKLDELGYDVSIICDEIKYNNKKDAPINKNVKKINLKSFLSLYSPLKFKNYIHKEKPDVVFAYFFKDLINLSLCLKDTKVIMMLHNPPTEIFAKLNPVTKAICKFLLKKVVSIQVLMPEFVQQVKDFVGEVDIEVIPNQVMLQKEEKKYNINTKTIIHVAQISKFNKRQHLLIEAFSKIAHKHPDWKVHFFGQVKKGKHKKYYNECLNRIKELKLEKQIFFKGFSKNITQEYLNSEINTLPSRSEGFGYGLADGLALGLPSVGFADSAAINEIIIDNKSGFLVKDIDDYAEKLDLLISNKKLRQQLGQYGRNDMQNRYSPELVISAWQELIEKVLK